MIRRRRLRAEAARAAYRAELRAETVAQLKALVELGPWGPQ